MPLRSLAIVSLLGSTALFIASAHADADRDTIKFTVLRNDNEIGTNTITVSRSGDQTTVQIVTHVKVKFAFVTLYQFDQSDTKQWIGDQLVTLRASTDDNGTIHQTTAQNNEGKMIVQGDGQITELAASILPVSLWNFDVLKHSTGFDPQSGSMVPISVVDRGVDDLMLLGHTEPAHHYVLTTTFPEDLWYDDNHRLVKLELKGPDGSTIRYQLN
jgi:hypothetical protein